MRLPTKSKKDISRDIDGHSLDHLAALRTTAMNRYMPIERRAACMDSLPEEYRQGLPQEVEGARKAFREHLGW